MKNTPAIQQALLEMIDQRMTRAQIAEAVGVSGSTVGDWASGQAKEIRPSHWAKLEPFLLPFLYAMSRGAKSSLAGNPPAALSAPASGTKSFPAGPDPATEGRECYEFGFDHAGGPCPNCAVLAASIASLASRADHLTPAEREALSRVADIMRADASRPGPTPPAGASSDSPTPKARPA